MKLLRLARARLTGLFRKEELAAEIEDEVQFHVAMRTREYIARGMSPAEAAREAQRKFGNVGLIKDAWRDVSGGGALESFAQDVRFAARTLLKDRAFTFVAVLALALGIGANTALFTVLSNVLLRPLPYTAPEEIMSIATRDRTSPDDPFPLSYPDFLDLRARTQGFERIGAFRAGSFVVRSDGGEAARVQGAWVTADVFPLLRAKPAMGRNFTRAEEEPGARVALISDAMWQERFGRAANVTQTVLTVNGLDYAVVGVMSPEFRFPVQNDPAQFWITFANELALLPDGSAPFPLRRDSHFLRVLGRLKPGVTAAGGAADLSAIATDLAAKYPDTNRYYDACIVRPWLDEITMRVRPVLLMLIGAAFFTLCVACANVANLLLARGSTRRKEIAVRAALGAGRNRIFRQLLTESLLLASIGGASGLLIALIGTRYLVASLPQDFPRASEIAPDLRVLAFTIALTFTTSCLFGLLPGWRAARAKLGPLLNDGTPQCSEPPVGRRTRNLLVMGEMVIAFVLLAGACFFISHLARLQAAPLGFDPRDVTTVNLFVPDDKRADLPERVAAFSDDLIRRILRLDNVQGASVVSRPPLSPSLFAADFAISGREIATADLPLAQPHMIVPGYFRTMGIPVRHGRTFDARDQRNAPPVVIVNQTLASRFFPGESAIGKRITPGLYADPIGPVEREIVGVVGDVQSDITAAEPMPQIYVPLSQCMWLDLTLVVRSKWEPNELWRAIEDVVADLAPSVAVRATGTMEDRVNSAAAAPRLNSKLLSAFASVAVLLTAIGVYGVMAYSVAQRRHDIGIRLALGAQKRDVFRLVLGEGVRLIAGAVVVGAMFAICMLPLLGALAHGTTVNYLPVVLLSAVLLGTIAVLACWLPARRAAAMDPLAALNER
ncbi:MAG TPA: ABC transporter permease [Chthoniobacterales bacterium]